MGERCKVVALFYTQQYYGMKGVSIIIPIITTKCFVFAIFFDLMLY